MAYRLGRTVDELLDTCTAEEISEWLSWFDLEDPEEAEWRRTSLICATMVNCANIIGRGRYPEKVEPDHYVPKKQTRTQKSADQRDILKALFPQ